MELPKFIGLKSNYNQKYLRYIHEDTEVHGLHQFSSDVAVSGYAKFQVEQAKIGNGLVHIRSVYNNKYWVRWSSQQWWIAANADVPDEDKSKWTCTLFEPILLDVDDDSQPLTLLRHVQLGHFLCLWRASPPYNSCLFAGSKDPHKQLLDVFGIFDWDSLFILPKHIAFKGDNGTKDYLGGKNIQGTNYLIFEGSDVSSIAVAHEMFPADIGDGTVGIKCVQFDKFWARNSSDWVVADALNSNPNDPNTLFFPTKVSDNVVALRNLGNKLFCKRLTKGGITGGLSANISTITLETKLELQELVASRKIGNVEFRLRDGRIYNKKDKTAATSFVINRLQQPALMEVRLSYMDTSIRTWSSTVSMKLDVETSMKSNIPVVSGDKLEIGPEFVGEIEWGEPKNLTKIVDAVHKVTVQPMTKTIVKLVATQASFDVPFSYIQNDTLLNSQTIALKMDDGIYTGINLYNLKYETESLKL